MHFETIFELIIQFCQSPHQMFWGQLDFFILHLFFIYQTSISQNLASSGWFQAELSLKNLWGGGGGGVIPKIFWLYKTQSTSKTETNSCCISFHGKILRELVFLVMTCVFSSKLAWTLLSATKKANFWSWMVISVLTVNYNHLRPVENFRFVCSLSPLITSTPHFLLCSQSQISMPQELYLYFRHAVSQDMVKLRNVTSRPGITWA